MYLQEQLEKFKILQSVKKKKDAKDNQSSEAQDGEEQVESLPLMSELSEQHQAMIDGDLAEDQKNILISMMLEVEESSAVIKNIRNKLSEISLSETQTNFKRVVVLHAGDSFGELALIDSRKGVRAATITCLE